MDETVAKVEDLKIDDGEVLVKKNSGKVKIRKGQTEEAFQEQLEDFQKQGPTVNEIGWLRDQSLDQVNVNDKVSVTKYLHLLELLYYKRQYRECSTLCKDFILRFTTDEITLEIQSSKKSKSKLVFAIKEVQNILHHCELKLAE